MLNRLIPAIFFLALIWAPSGCGLRGTLPSPAEDEVAPCLLGEAGKVRPGIIEFAVSDTLNLALAPVPGNDSERVLFRHLFEGLVGADCEGRLFPSLASSWRSLEGDRVWEFEIRPGARFSDGSPVSAERVRQSWSRNRFRFPGSEGRPPWSWVHPESVKVVGKSVLRVHLRRAMGSTPSLFAHAALAVAQPGANGLPVGTGPFLTGESEGNTITCRPNPRHPQPGLSSIRFTSSPGADSRDLIGPASDAAVVRERDAVAYAREIEDLQVVPLGWSRVYLLTSPHFPGSKTGPGCEEHLSELRRELAASVLESEAMEATSFFQDGARASVCKTKPLGEPWPTPPRDSRIAFWNEDRDAGAIAARLVALAGSEDSTSAPGILCLAPDEPPVAAGESLPRLISAAVRGTDLAYVFGVRREYPVRCLDLWSVMEIIPWLGLPAEDEESMFDSESRLRSSAVPLVVSRSSLIFRRTLAGVGVSWDGLPLFHRAGWSGERRLP